MRLQRSLFNKSSGATRALTPTIATIEFTYTPNLEMDDQNRIENPLGFWVTSYRVDDDYATAPPAEIPGPPIASTAGAQTGIAPAVPAATAVTLPGPAMATDSATGASRQ